MKITVEGVVYEWEPDSLLVSEGIEIQRLTEMTMHYWNDGVIAGEALPRKALAYLLKKRAGEDPDWATLDFPMSAMEIDLGDEEAEQDEPAQPLDPTSAESSSSA